MSLFFRRNLKSKIIGTSLLATTAGTALYLANDERRKKANLVFDACNRVTNLASIATVMTFDYTYYLYYKHLLDIDSYTKKYQELRSFQELQETLTLNCVNSSSPEDKKQWSNRIQENRIKIDELSMECAVINNHNRLLFYHDLHTRNARRLAQICLKNRGLYIKLGQHLAMLDYVLPQEYLDELKILLDQTPHSSKESIERVFLEDLHALPEQVFDSFDYQPIASASLAQVHIAYKNNQKLAVKVQHENLQQNSVFDRFVITILIECLHKWFREDFDYRWLAKEMNLNVPIELNFCFELENILKMQKYFKQLLATGELALPQPFREHSSSRILTMSFEEGVYVNKLDHIETEMKLRRRDISSAISNIFAQQLFRFGFLHCDPHEANLLVRPNPQNPSKPQIVLLDHGLYRELNPNFRSEYTRLWQGILLGNEEQIKKHSQAMNSGELYSLLAAMLTLKPWDVIADTEPDLERLKSKNTQGEKLMLQSYCYIYMHEILYLLRSVPSDLLLVFKANDCLRHLDKLLQTPINSTAVTAKVIAEVLLEEDLQQLYKQWNQTTWLEKSRTLSLAIYNWFQVMTRAILLSGLSSILQLIFSQ